MTCILKRPFIFLPVVVLLVTSCASEKDIIYLNNQVNALYRQKKTGQERFEKSLEVLEKRVKANEAKQSEIEGEVKGKIQESLKEDQQSLGLNLAQLGAELAEIKDTIQTLTGRIEENRNLLKRTVEEDTTQEDALRSQTNEYSRLIQDLTVRVEQLESHYRSGTISGKEKPPQKTKAAEAEDVQTESGLYEKALGQFQEKRYQEAIAGFRKFLKLYPQSDLADNAQFWIGECHRASGDYEEAILAYQKVINGYPKGNKVPAAMLQQGFAFEKLNDNTTAKLVFKKLLKGFPKSKEAEIAKKRLAKK